MVATQGEDDDAYVENLLQSMDWNAQVGQMAQIDINKLLNDEKTGLQQDLLDHYIGTMGVGSVLNNNINKYWTIREFRDALLQIQATAKKFDRPPVIWGLDSVHGANYLPNTITTPQPLNLAATFNTTLSYQAGIWASRDTRRAGINWLFSPLLGISWNPIWSRVYETFGEDPVLVGSMALAMTQGIQEVDDSSGIVPSRAAACGKHWVGYSIPHNGHDRAPSWVPIRHLYQYFLPPWKRVLPHILTVMESYTEIDGVPNAANRQTLQTLLRNEMGFQGMLVTDYHEIFNLFEWHHTAKDRTAALRQSLQEGSVDMSMIANEPDDFFAAMQTLQNATSFAKRVETSARRVLRLKKELRMFEESFNMTNTEDNSGPSEEDLQAALQMTRQSIVLAENNNDALPLNTEEPLKILLTGPTSNSLSFQSGGWTGKWQGVDSNREDEWFHFGSTIHSALHMTSENWEVTYECGVDILGHDCQEDDGAGELQHEQHSNENAGVMGTIKGWVGWNDEDQDFPSIDSAMNTAADSDVVIVCVGEENYTEKPGDIRSLQLPSGQIELVVGLRQASPDAKILLVYFGGRPRLLAEMVEHVDAVLIGFLPGPLAGDAVLSLMTGEANPSAKLPITYPKYEDGGGVPYLHAVSDKCTEDTGGTLPHWENAPCEVQWPFGHGLSYSTFEYEDLEVNTDRLQHLRRSEEDSSLTVTVTVKNSGSYAGAETVLFFTFDDFRATSPEYKRLRGFEKVLLEPGSSTKVSITVPLEDLRFVGPHDETHYILQNGLSFRVGVGAHTDCRVNPDDSLCSSPVTIVTDSDYVGACEAACSLWSSSGCSGSLGLSMDDCWDMCSSIHSDTSGDLGMNNDGWGWNYVHCMESIVWGGTFEPGEDCWKLTTFCRDVISTPNMDEFGSGRTPNTFAHPGINSTLALILAMASGVLSSMMVIHAMRGGFTKKDDDFGDVQFTTVNTEEVM